jgi:PRC-barrel domain protein
MFEDETAIAWKAMPYRATVVTADGNRIGTAESLLGDEEEDIFHGIAVKTTSGRLVEVPAARVKKITRSGVLTDLDESGAASLENYREERWFHIGWGGLFRKHPEWEPRSGS